jgi:hypothetical protein
MSVRMLPERCPDVAGMLSGCCRNGCPDVAEIRTLLRERPTVKYAFIHEYRSEYRLEKMCKVMEVSRSG